MTKPIGILGGSFDPVHKGHIHIAQHCYEELGLQCVKFVPVNKPVHRNQLIASSEHRLNMLQLAVADYPEFVVDDIELQRADDSYTIDTLKQLKQTQTTTPLCFIMGNDAFHTLHTWKDWQQLFNYAHIVVLSRKLEQISVLNNALKQELEKRLSTDKEVLHKQTAGMIYQLSIPEIDISATHVRQQHNNDATKAMLPEQVFNYIQKNKLYE